MVHVEIIARSGTRRFETSYAHVTYSGGLEYRDPDDDAVMVYRAPHAFEEVRIRQLPMDPPVETYQTKDELL